MLTRRRKSNGCAESTTVLFYCVLLSLVAKTSVTAFVVAPRLCASQNQPIAVPLRFGQHVLLFSAVPNHDAISLNRNNTVSYGLLPPSPTIGEDDIVRVLPQKKLHLHESSSLQGPSQMFFSRVWGSSAGEFHEIQMVKWLVQWVGRIFGLEIPISESKIHYIRHDRQRFEVGQHPSTVTLRKNPLRCWLNDNYMSTTALFVNGSVPEPYLAPFNHVDSIESKDSALTLELLAELRGVPRPGYLNMVSKQTLWITGFSVTGRGHASSMDCRTGSIKHYEGGASSLRWPNEVQAVPGDPETVLICDGFLVPTKDKGGLYLLHSNNNTIQRLTAVDDRWFYHRAVWVDLTGDGRMSVLTVRCRLSPLEQGELISKTGQLVWLEPPVTPNGPWVTRVLAVGPDIMFAVADMDPGDDCIEILASEFFSQRVMLYSIQRGSNPKVVFQRVIDDHCGHAYSCILANLEPTEKHQQLVVDTGSTVECLLPGDTFSHLLVTSHDCAKRSVDTLSNLTREGGSVYAYQAPTGAGDAWKTESWQRTMIASGFKVNVKLNNMINPGAPGFVYTFLLKKGDDRSKTRPFIAVAGDCAESAYIFQPHGHEGTCYKLLTEIQCDSTVGSLAVSYDSLGDRDNQGFARLFVPCHEKNSVLVFGFGNLLSERFLSAAVS